MSDGAAPILRVLAYHKIDRRPELGINTIAPDRFCRHLDILRSAGFAPLTASALASIVAGAWTPPARAVHLTFDDGYANFGEVAWECCAARGFPATVFVVSGFIGRKNLWDRSFPAAHHLDWSQLRALHAAGVTIGAHSVTHPFLTHMPPKRAYDEMAASKRHLEDGLGAPVTALAYPYGAHSSALLSLAAEAGFELAFTLDPAPSFLSAHPLALPRVAVYALDGPSAVCAKLGLRGESAWRRQCIKNRWLNRCAYANLLDPFRRPALPPRAHGE
jgi:peptidoglycan/xylan/chitin deacetylase (PgdA/CDA1 family)